MTKITPEHLARAALVYIRQSTANQVLHCQESQRRQYGLADRARELGWTDVDIIDEDLGRSAGGVVRPGFDRLLAAICAGDAGAVFAIEASRLARNGRDWHTLIEFCGLVGVIIVDEDGVYDPRLPNDRMVLGMKGTMSELELSTFRQRSQEALKQKAKRGELFLNIPAGYVKNGRDRIEKDPDQRVHEALTLVFSRFPEFQSVRKLQMWLRDESIMLPVANRSGEDGRSIQWKLPRYGLVHNILTNPIYAGAYAFGRTASKVSIQDGRKRVRRGIRREQADWQVLIKDHHEGYITWSEFDSNQRLISENITSHGGRERGAVREGEALLTGLVRCGHCGRKLYVSYGKGNGRYYCSGGAVHYGTQPCISLGGSRADQAVGAEVLRVLKPLGLEAALQAIQMQTNEAPAARRQIELALEQARYETARARRQYDAVDPDNRLVAGELEHRWNDRLTAQNALEADLAAFDARRQDALGDEERRHFMRLGADLELAWSHPAATAATRKRIIRALLHEIIVRVEEDHIAMVLHWQGGAHTALQVKKSSTGKHRWTVAQDTVDLVRQLARHMSDEAIARLLNRVGKPTGRNNGWTHVRVRSFRNHHQIEVYRDGERAERGEIGLEEAAAALSVSDKTVLRMIERGVLKAHQPCKGAPWVIKADDLNDEKVRAAAKLPRRRPQPQNPLQQTFQFQ